MFMKSFIVEEIAMNSSFSITRYIPNKCENNFVIICFDEIAGGLKKIGFGVNFFISKNIEVFFISHKSRSFYQELSEEELYSVLCQYLNNKKIFTYGASLGGYAAIYYANSLDAQPIAFSPRCSIDPVYNDSKAFGVEFKHIPLNEKIITNYKEPIVIIDRKIKKDIKFFEKRISPLYKGQVIQIPMDNASHFTAAVMSELGILKDFILNTIQRGWPPEVNFTYTDSAISLSILALKNAKTGNFEKANFYLEKIVGINKQPWGNSRLLTYDILIKQDKLSHFFKKDSIFSSEILATINEYSNKIKKTNDTHEILLLQFKMHHQLMEYNSAKVLASKMARIYLKEDKYGCLVNDIDDVLYRAKKWIL